MARHQWTPSQVERLELFYPALPTEEVARLLCIPMRTVTVKAEELQLQKDPRYVPQEACASPAALTARLAPSASRIVTCNDYHTNHAGGQGGFACRPRNGSTLAWHP
jgi:hypothetical protein